MHLAGNVALSILILDPGGVAVEVEMLALARGSEMGERDVRGEVGAWHVYQHVILKIENEVRRMIFDRCL